ncbi:MAG: hypothetical protein QMC36_08990 [Patescibacteria group bacterium]
MSVERLAKEGFAAQEPLLAVQVGDAAPFQSPLQVQVDEAPEAGKAGVVEAVPCQQNESDQNEASANA